MRSAAIRSTQEHVMSATFTSSLRLASLLLVIGVGLAACAGVATAPLPAVQQQIEAARTPADHEALAAYCIKEAAAARAKAVEHRAMGRSSDSSPPGGRGGSWIAHCNATANSYQEIATRYDVMATEHRQVVSQQ
jgi:hypothetical protein